MLSVTSVGHYAVGSDLHFRSYLELYYLFCGVKHAGNGHYAAAPTFAVFDFYGNA